jgi:hypothetical protein
MPRTPSKTSTEKEFDIMGVSWESGEATACEIQARLPDERHYNSVLTIIRVLERKGQHARESLSTYFLVDEIVFDFRGSPIEHPSQFAQTSHSHSDTCASPCNRNATTPPRTP